MNSRFDNIFQHLIGYEGGYSNHSADYGGQTKYGITKETAELYGYKGEMKNLTLHLTKKIYYDMYWVEPGINQIEDDELAGEVFEQGVNMGTAEAIKRLQKAYNLLTGKDIAEDGLIGPQTLRAVNGYSYPSILYNLINVLQGEKYINLVEDDNSQRVFLRGWLKRINIIKG